MSKHKLHSHPDMERKLGVPHDHVIIDVSEYHKAISAVRELAAFRDASKRTGHGVLDLSRKVE